MNARQEQVANSGSENNDVCPPNSNENSSAGSVENLSEPSEPVFGTAREMQQFAIELVATEVNVVAGQDIFGLRSNGVAEAGEPLLILTADGTSSEHQSRNSSRNYVRREGFLNGAEPIDDCSDLAAECEMEDRNETKNIRRSCAPNCKLTHYLDRGNNLRTVLTAVKRIETNTELTIPFDKESQTSTTPLHCAIHYGRMNCCEAEVDRILLSDDMSSMITFENGNGHGTH